MPSAGSQAIALSGAANMDRRSPPDDYEDQFAAWIGAQGTARKASRTGLFWFGVGLAALSLVGAVTGLVLQLS